MEKQIQLKNGCSMTVYLNKLSEEIYWKARPMVIICPGGGYSFRSDREAEPIAYRFLAAGFHAAVLDYSVAPARYPTAARQLAEAVQVMRRNSDAWGILPEQIYVMGFSAGGHLAATLGTLWQEAEIADVLPKDVSHKPDGQILCYPVINSGEYAHRGSFECLVGDEGDPCWEKLSLEKQVTKDTVPAFIWHTCTDNSVPVENSLLYAMALRRNGVPFEMHLYENGVHGLSLCDETTAFYRDTQLVEDNTGWIELAKQFIQRRMKS